MTEKRERGRPPVYTKALADTICQRIAKGESLRRICEDKAMPDITTVMKWARELPDFTQQYAQAREEQAECMADELLQIADEATPEQVNQARLRIDTRKWVASKLKPKKYGDKVAIGGADDLPPIQTEELSAIEIAKRTAYLLRAGLEEMKKE